MKRSVLIVLSLLASTPVWAQQANVTQEQANSPAFLQRVIGSMQGQRNVSNDAVAVLEAKVVGLTDDLNKANAKIKELEDKSKSEPDKKP